MTTKKRKSKNDYERLVGYFERAQKKYPQSYVAIDSSDGKIIVHRLNREEFFCRVSIAQESNPSLFIGIIFPKMIAEEAVTNLILLKGIGFGRLMSRVNSAHRRSLQPTIAGRLERQALKLRADALEKVR